MGVRPSPSTGSATSPSQVTKCTWSRPSPASRTCLWPRCRSSRWLSPRPPAGARPSSSGLRRLVPVGVRTAIRQRLGPFTLPSAARRLGEIIARLQPDLVHALRIPYEGMLAALALADTASPPLVISVWGNDFTLHAPSSPRMRRYTRQAVSARRRPAGRLPPRPAPGRRLGLRSAETICRPARRGRRAARHFLPACRR